MQTQVSHSPSYSMTTVTLDPNEEIRVESGSMVSMSHGIELKTKAEGGLLKSLSRAVFGGESFFINVYKASSRGGTLNLAPALPGDMAVLDLSGQTMLIQGGSYVASEMGVDVNTKWGGAKTFFASEGLIMLKASGAGKVLVSSYGAIHKLSLADGEKHIVDTGHLVAFPESMRFDVKSIGGVRSTLFSGEGLVVELEGPGDVYMQTRSEDAFLSWLIPQLPSKGPDN